jgi:hypothetical protein
MEYWSVGVLYGDAHYKNRSLHYSIAPGFLRQLEFFQGMPYSC